MKIAFQVEGPLDRRVLVAFVESILGRTVSPTIYQKRVGGVDEVFRTLRAAAWQAWREGCLGAVLAVDADSTTAHHSHVGASPGDCRHCEIRSRLPRLPARAPLPDLSFAVAVPVRAIEAWLLQFGHRVDRRSPGPPHLLPREEAKRLLWDSCTPTRDAIERVCDAILPQIGPPELDSLTTAQASFAAFRAEVEVWKALAAD